jgi:hypothetical protein
MDRTTLERFLAQVEVQIATAREHVRQQEKLVTNLPPDAADIDIATRALNVARHSLEMYVADRDRIRRMLEENPP